MKAFVRFVVFQLSPPPVWVHSVFTLNFWQIIAVPYSLTWKLHSPLGRSFFFSKTRGWHLCIWFGAGKQLATAIFFFIPYFTWIRKSYILFQFLSDVRREENACYSRIQKEDQIFFASHAWKYIILNWLSVISQQTPWLDGGDQCQRGQLWRHKRRMESCWKTLVSSDKERTYVQL
jgi:hypothetical protein